METRGFSYNGEYEMVLHGEVNPNGSPTTYYFDWGKEVDAHETEAENVGSGINSIEVTSEVYTRFAEGGEESPDFAIHPDGFFCEPPWYSRIVAENEYGTSYGEISRSWECF